MATRKLPGKIEQLIADALGPLPAGETHSTLKLAALAKALTEVGIPSKVATCSVAFDPENWTNPHHFDALRIKSCTTDGYGVYGWDALIESERARQGCAGDYVDRQGVGFSTWDELYKMNEEFFGGEMNAQLQQMRAHVQNWKLDQETPASRPSPRRPGL